MAKRWFPGLVAATLALALLTVVLGAFVRLSHAGLGCPDWPGCYGQLLGVPATGEALAHANRAFPQRPVQAGKAWREVTHRYVAATLGLAILVIAVWAWTRRARPGQPVGLPLALLALVVFQAMLGMLTVTWKLKPLIVMAHLLGGLATLAGLWWLSMASMRWPQPDTALRRYRPWVAAGLLILVIQIALGGWTSANYAALACPDFPTCQGQWWPRSDFADAFVLWRGLGVDYELGVLDNPARTAIQLTHRLGALVTVSVLFALAAALWARARERAPRVAALVLLGLLTLQVSLGISNVLLGLPLAVAVAHNATAGLLLLTVLALLRMTIGHRARA